METVEPSDGNLHPDVRGMRDPGPEELIWSTRPALRVTIPILIIMLILSVAGFIYGPVLMQAFVNISGAIIPWTSDMVAWLYTAYNIAVWLPVLSVVMYQVYLATTIYELTTQRVKMHHGILVRRHDEVGLHRIRDYVTRRTLFDMILMVGRVKLHTRDPVFPLFAMRPVSKPKKRTSDIRNAAFDYKRRIGYREFEGW